MQNNPDYMTSAQQFVEAIQHNMRGVTNLSPGIAGCCTECRRTWNLIEGDLNNAVSDGSIINEGGFSRSSCECCGSHTCGIRYSAHGFVNDVVQHFEICEDCLCYLANGDLPKAWPAGNYANKTATTLDKRRVTSFGPNSGLDPFTRAYIEAALWSSMDESDESGGEPMDKHYSIKDIAPETLAIMIADCEQFQRENSADIAAGRIVKRQGLSEAECAGHDFWLTRCGHGAGFWDGDWPEEAGERMTESSRRFGEIFLYIGDDGLIWDGSLVLNPPHTAITQLRSKKL